MIDRTPTFLFILSLTFASLTSFAQQTVFSPSIPLPPDIEAQLAEYLRDYRVYEIDTERLQNLLLENSNMPVPMDGIDTINISVQQTNVLSFDYFCSTLSVYKDNYTYKGLITEGEDLRITIDENFLYGYFNLGEDQIFFEPLRLLLDQSINNQYFIFYKDEDVINDEERICNASITTERTEEAKELATEAKMMGCFEVKLAIASDRGMFNRYGSIDDIEDRNVGIMNNVQGNYTDEFNDDIEFRIVQQVVINNNSNPFGTQSTTDASTILATFANWASTGGFSVPFDLAQLWTTTNIAFNGNNRTIGLAYLPGICKPIGKFHILEDFSANAGLLRTLTSHEIGHNFNARHVNEVAIMSSTLIETNNWSSANRTAISNRIRSPECQSGASALEECGNTPPPPPGGCPSVVNVSGTAAGTYVATQTIQTVGTTNVFGTATFRSGNRVLLRPGFWARSGSNFNAIIRNIGQNECNNNINLNKEVEERTAAVTTTIPNNTLLLAPNPARDEVQLSFELVTASEVNIALFDAQGQMVRSLSSLNLDSGTQQLQLDVAAISNGLYYIVVRHTEGQLVKRLAISR